MLVEGIVFGFPTIERQLAMNATHKVVALWCRCVVPSSFDHLLHLTRPASLRFVRPTYRERGPSSIGIELPCGIFHIADIHRVILSEAHQYCPPAVTGVCHMLLDRIVVRFPAIQRSIAQVAHGVIIAVG